MPKLTIPLTAKQLIQDYEGMGLDDLTSHIIEYAPDHGFPDTTGADLISFDDHRFTPEGRLVLTFDYEEEVEDEEEEDDED